MLHAAEPPVVCVCVAVEQLDDRIFSRGIALIGWWQVDRNLAIRGIAFEIPFEQRAMDADDGNSAARRSCDLRVDHGSDDDRGGKGRCEQVNALMHARMIPARPNLRAPRV